MYSAKISTFTVNYKNIIIREMISVKVFNLFFKLDITYYLAQCSELPMVPPSGNTLNLRLFYPRNNVRIPSIAYKTIFVNNTSFTITMKRL